MLRTHCLVHSVLGECSTPENAALNNACLVLPAPGYRRTESRPAACSTKPPSQGKRKCPAGYIGLNKVHVPVISKIILLFKFLASFFFGFFFLKSGRSHRNRAKVATCAVALLFILSFLLDLFWYSYIGHLQSSATFTALYFVRHLVGGVIVAMGGNHHPCEERESRTDVVCRLIHRIRCLWCGHFRAETHSGRGPLLLLQRIVHWNVHSLSNLCLA